MIGALIMKITKILVHQVDLPVTNGSYRISHGRDYSSFKSTIVVLETDTAHFGIGECCPFGAAYAAAFPGGVAPGISEIAPLLVGQDPHNIAAINALMDANLIGHSYIKSPIDIACWDLIGKSAGMPIHRLVGGRLCDDFDPRMGIPVATATDAVEYMRRLQNAGFRFFNAKAGDNPDLDVERMTALAESAGAQDVIVIDANGGWRIDEAVYVMSALSKFPKLYFEQPCGSFDECVAVRKRINSRIVLDESLNSFQTLLQAWREGIADAITMKINKVGGFTKARLIRDICMEIGVPIIIQDSWGSQITEATVAQLCHSTLPKYLLGGWCTSGQVAKNLIVGPHLVTNGKMAVSDAPGLGITVRMDLLGAPIAVYDH